MPPKVYFATPESDSVAQLVEQLTLNQWVESSNLSGVTKIKAFETPSFEGFFYSIVLSRHDHHFLGLYPRQCRRGIAIHGRHQIFSFVKGIGCAVIVVDDLHAHQAVGYVAAEPAGIGSCQVSKVTTLPFG